MLLPCLSMLMRTSIYLDTNPGLNRKSPKNLFLGIFSTQQMAMRWSRASTLTWKSRPTPITSAATLSETSARSRTPMSVLPIMATHDLGQARRLVTDVVFLLNGQLQDQGLAPKIFNAPGTPQSQAFFAGEIVE